MTNLLGLGRTDSMLKRFLEMFPCSSYLSDHLTVFGWLVVNVESVILEVYILPQL